MQVRGGFVVHVCQALDASFPRALRVGDALELHVDEGRRPVMNNHTGTHVLNFAARRDRRDGPEGIARAPGESAFRLLRRARLLSLLLLLLPVIFLLSSLLFCLRAPEYELANSYYSSYVYSISY